MVTITKIGEEYNSQILEISGLSTDPKPVDQIDGVSIANGSTFKEIDTGKEYTYNESAKTWHVNKTASSGSGSGLDGEDGGYYTPGVTQPTTNTMQISFTPSKSDMPAVNPVTVTLPVSEGSGENANGIVPDGRVIDLEKYGITAVDYEPPFTEEMYHVAYANGTGIQQAIDDAKTAGMTDVVLPAGRYPVCYHAAADDEYNPIINIKGVNLHAVGVTLYIIYDEEGNNPYFTGATPRLLQGIAIATDSDIHGVHLIGERGYRVSAETKYQDHSLGIGLTSGCKGNILDGCICEKFSGDGFGAYKFIEQASVWEDTLTTVAWNGTEFVYDAYKFTSPRHGAYFLDQTKPMKIKPQGYNYILWTHAPIKVLCFNEAEEYIGTVSFWQGEYFYFLPGTYYWYYELRYGTPYAEDATVSYTTAIGYGYYSDTTLRNCIARYNQRGGMSNLPNNAHLIDCVAHHNGCAFDGMPAFYDGTQFGVDIEDVYINNIALERCNIFGNLHGVLWRCRNIKFIDCTIEGITRSLSSCGGFHAEHTAFRGALELVDPAEYGHKIAIGCGFAGAIPSEIVVLDDVAKIPVSAALVGPRQSLLEMRNAAGEVVVSIDLAYLGKAAGESAAVDALLDMDATKFTAEELEQPDNTGNAVMTLSSAEVITELGVAAKSAYPTINGKWERPPDIGDNVTIEMFFLDAVPARMIGGSTYVLAQGRSYPVPLPPVGTHLWGPICVSGSYQNGSSGTTAKKQVLEAWPQVIDADGNKKNLSEAALPGCGISHYAHIVAIYRDTGEADVYINGYRSVYRTDTPGEDFTGWVWDDLLSAINILNGDENSTRAILRSVRIYNRALTEADIRNNLAYEMKKLGTVYVISKTLTNATLDSPARTVRCGEPYAATITAKDGYTLEGATVTVLMGEEDITETAYADGAINIDAMMDDVTVTVTAVAVETA